jgi:hypothetical protein
MFEALKSKAKAAKPAEPKLSLIPGAKPVTSAEFKVCPCASTVSACAPGRGNGCSCIRQDAPWNRLQMFQRSVAFGRRSLGSVLGHPHDTTCLLPVLGLPCSTRPLLFSFAEWASSLLACRCSKRL